MPATRLIYLSPVPLRSFAQRPHHFVAWYHERFDAEVMWIDPYPARLPRWDDVYRLKRQKKPLLRPRLGADWTYASWIHLVEPTAIPLEPINLGRVFNQWLWSDLASLVQRWSKGRTQLVIGKPCALAVQLAQLFAPEQVIFDVMDNMPAFSEGRSQAWVGRMESELVARAGTVVASSTPLQQLMSARYGREVMCAHNATTPPPEELLARRNEFVQDSTKGLRLGYIGAISRWFDWDLVLALAQTNPDAHIDLIGPCDRPPDNLPANIALHPAQPQDSVYQTLLQFDVGLIPFKISDLTDYVDPVKYYEYRAAGLPVLSSRFGEMRFRGANDGVVFFEDLAPGYDLAESLAKRQSPASIGDFLRKNQWHSRFDALDWPAP